MKLSEYSKLNNITYRTAWNRFKAGKISGAKLDKSGHVIIEDISNNSTNSSNKEWGEL